LLDTTIAVLRGENLNTILEATELSLQELATKSRIRIELETKDFCKTILPRTIRTTPRSMRRKR
jgi:hypothetical protein